MSKDYHSKHSRLEDKPYIDKHGRRDVLLGMAKAGNKLGNAPPLINNNWAKAMAEDYSDIHGSSSPDLSDALSELKRIHRKYKTRR